MRIVVYQNKWNDNIEAGLLHVLEKVEDILKNGQVDFLVLPEFFVGPPWFQPGQTFQKGITDDTIPGRISDSFCRLAVAYNCNIIMGTIIERRGEKYYNTSTFIDNKGVIKAKVNKMHTFAGESVTCEKSKEIASIESNFGTIGIAVCSDFWIPEHMEILALKGAEVIFIPGGTLGQNVGPMIQALKTIAYLTSTIVVYASPVGEIVGRRGDYEVRLSYTGTSLIATPEKVVQVAADGKEDIIEMSVPDDYIRKYRESSLCWKRLQGSNRVFFKEILNDYIGKTCEVSEMMKSRMKFDNDN